MAWFNFNKKQAEKVTDVSRIEVEDMIDQDYTCKEIAEELDVPIEKVYLLKQNKERREARKGIVKKETSPASDEVTEARKQIELLKLEDQKAELEHKNFIRQREREDIQNEGFEDIIDDSQNPDKMLNTLIMSWFLKNNANTGVSNRQNDVVNSTNPQPIRNTEAPVNASNVRQMIDALKSGAIPDDIAIGKAVEMGLTESEANALLKALKKTK